jgi:hypothetical protein
VLTYTGTSTIAAISTTATPQLVYNLEVKDLHNFLAGSAGVVVHNTCLDEVTDASSKAKLLIGIPKELQDEVVDEVGGEAIEKAIRLKRQLTWPEVQALFKRGNDFNKKGLAEYSNSKCEIVLGNGKRLDTYIPGKKIISRKATNIDMIEESTWRNYCKELVTKYKKGTPVKSSKMPGEPPLSGDYYIEIPNSNLNATKLNAFRAIAQSAEFNIKDIIFLSE